MQSKLHIFALQQYYCTVAVLSLCLQSIIALQQQHFCTAAAVFAQCTAVLLHCSSSIICLSVHLRLLNSPLHAIKWIPKQFQNSFHNLSSFTIYSKITKTGGVNIKAIYSWMQFVVWYFITVRSWNRHQNSNCIVTSTYLHETITIFPSSQDPTCETSHELDIGTITFGTPADLTIIEFIQQNVFPKTGTCNNSTRAWFFFLCFGGLL